MKISEVPMNQKQAIQKLNKTIHNSFWFIKLKKMLHDDILLWWYYVQYGLGVFHNKHHKYINVSQLITKKFKELLRNTSKIFIYSLWELKPQFDSWKWKRYHMIIYSCNDIVHNMVYVYSILNTIRISLLVS